MNKIRIFFNSVHELLTRENLYLIALILMVVLIVVSARSEGWAQAANKVVFNAIWPAFIAISEMYFKHKEKIIVQKQKTAIDGISATIIGEVYNGNSGVRLETLKTILKENDLISAAESVLSGRQIERNFDESNDPIQGHGNPDLIPR